MGIKQAADNFRASFPPPANLGSVQVLWVMSPDGILQFKLLHINSGTSFTLNWKEVTALRDKLVKDTA